MPGYLICVDAADGNIKIMAGPRDARIGATTIELTGYGQDGHLHKALNQVLAGLNLSHSQLFSKLECLAINIGPGSFTGLRMSCALVNGINLLAQVPLVTVTVFDLLAQAPLPITASDLRLLLPVSKRRDYFWQLLAGASRIAAGNDNAVAITARIMATHDAKSPSEKSVAVTLIGADAERFEHDLPAMTNNLIIRSSHNPQPLEQLWRVASNPQLAPAGKSSRWAQPYYLRHADVTVQHQP